MENQKAVTTKSLTKILKYLPRATSSVSFRSPPLYSPAKDKKPSEKPHKSNLGTGFSGPMLSINPSETHRKIKNDSKVTLLLEPTSPRVSCMGHVKCKHYRKLTGANNITNKPNNKYSRTTSYNPVRAYKPEEDQEEVVKSKKKSGISRLLFSDDRRKCDETEEKSTMALTVEKGPCLSTMKKFSSGRDAFMSFDWTTQVAPLDGSEGEEVVMPSSAPVMVRNKGVCDSFVRVGRAKLEPRKEVNLWKRRTMAKPRPLQVYATN